ncbi:hypothetical protein [Flagellimonas sp.]|uniref:hypothetical protein n=1 Tax=Flagellimonas sp. TaxID=2058762 RepID=UPI003BA89775|tara:strand:+ start:3733 stop:4446 length:714 start_codon:yes stop_codon:yes gene_type:complete
MNENFNSLKKELTQLKHRSRIKDIFFVILIIVIYFLSKQNSFRYDKIIRVQGIVVEDANGKERILIGAPIPYAKNRARTDTTKIKETWGKRFGEKYMNWYREYNHEANGMVILDENGWDKVIVGDPAPDPIIGKRIGNSTGIIINDKTGLERTGYGILDVNGSDRVVLGLDNGNGTEGATLSLMPDGTTGLNLNSDNQTIFIGKAAKGNWNSPDKEEFHGIIIRDVEKGEKIITQEN